MATSIPRFLLPLGHTFLGPRARQLLPRQPIQFPFPATNLRHASSKPRTLSEQFKKRAPPVIPQPDKYRPPSHGARTSRSETPMRSYGPKLTAAQREEMRTKKYPNMMSPEGTFSHWFLNNRSIHLYITLGILASLTAAAFYMDFVSKTIYGDLLPTQKDYMRHPISSVRRFLQVYTMHMEKVTQDAHEIRMKRAEETDKRRAFRQARIQEAEERGEEYIEDPRYYIGEDGIRRRRVKRWFGIWE
ncbi:hypothetical protein K504DRAFT_459054 [Pleomassaria siparia CBS 279.74]|uniref:Uncharacterized protein n=1 Tax=Pleomassaria siparia CBS 279.74 TaxID=1314801 RepID=A0A6G1K1H1_9PLEO|nr:hypothetical protein K504DRAFT_459054 [Pleomassaria siparia CBS 279.74]